MEQDDPENLVRLAIDAAGSSGSTAEGIAERLKMSPKDVKRVLGSLAARGLAVRTKERQRGYFGNALPVWRTTQMDFFRI